LADGTRIEVPPTRASEKKTITAEPVALPAAPAGTTEHVALGRLFGARSGDKGGNANVGVWARDAQGYAWLEKFLTVEQFKQLVPEAAHLAVRRYALPNLLSLNFVVVGILGEGVASSVRFDPQAKSLGEFLRSRVVDVPQTLLATAKR
jgi:hypothetical protein